MTLLLLCSLFDLESKPDEIDEDKNRETRSERHKRVSRPRNGNNFLELSLKLASRPHRNICNWTLRPNKDFLSY